MYTAISDQSMSSGPSRPVGTDPQGTRPLLAAAMSIPSPAPCIPSPSTYLQAPSSQNSPEEPGQQRVPRKRARDHLNCAECRRTKAKCSRVWPCSTCTKRGVAHLCPEGVSSVAPTKAETIAVLQRRVRELESSVRELEAGEEARGQSAFGVAATRPLASRNTATRLDSPQNMVGMLGEHHQPSIADIRPAQRPRLIASPRSTSKQLASLALGIEWPPTQSTNAVQTNRLSDGPFLLSAFDLPSEDAGYVSWGAERTDRHHASSLAPWATGRMDSSSTGTRDLSSALNNQCREFLISQLEAETVWQRYWQTTSWRHQPLAPSYVSSRLLPAIYGPSPQPHPHDLALLFSIIGLNMTFNTMSTSPAGSRSAAAYIELAYACLVEGSFYGNITLPSLVTLHHIGTFMVNADEPALADQAATIFSVAVRLAVSAGYHRDPSSDRPDTCTEEAEWRRRAWHELLDAERTSCLRSHAPSIIASRHTDTAMPLDVESRDYFELKWHLSSLKADIADIWATTHAPEQASLLQLDQQIRNVYHTIPERLKTAGMPADAFPPLEQMGTTRTFMNAAPLSTHWKGPRASTECIKQQISIAVDICMMFFHLHCPLFVQALEDGDASHAVSVEVIEEVCRYMIDLCSSILSLNFSMARWSSFILDLFSILQCQAALALRASPSNAALRIDRLARLVKGVGVIELTASLAPNAKNKQILRLARRLSKNAEGKQTSESAIALQTAAENVNTADFWSEFLETRRNQTMQIALGKLSRLPHDPTAAVDPAPAALTQTVNGVETYGLFDPAPAAATPPSPYAHGHDRHASATCVGIPQALAWIPMLHPDQHASYVPDAYIAPRPT